MTARLEQRAVPFFLSAHRWLSPIPAVTGRPPTTTSRDPGIRVHILFRKKLRCQRPRRWDTTQCVSSQPVAWHSRSFGNTIPSEVRICGAARPLRGTNPSPSIN